jgi:hypothetical protein
MIIELYYSQLPLQKKPSDSVRYMATTRLKGGHLSKEDSPLLGRLEEYKSFGNFLF